MTGKNRKAYRVVQNLIGYTSQEVEFKLVEEEMYQTAN